MSIEYDRYLKEHRENVKHGLEWMRDNLPVSTINKFAIEDALSEADQHDESKYSKEEYDAYDAHFYGDIKSHQVLQEFNKAWLHHQHMNPHHWQHWVLINDDLVDGTIALEMPLKYVYEMIADWWSFSWLAKANLFEIFNWYKLHQGRMILNQKTRFIVENILTIMFKVLSNQAMLEGADIPIDMDWLIAPVEVEVVYHSNDEGEDFGIPKLKKYPMPDKDHVRSAIRFFNYVDPKHEQELAEAIIEKAEEYGFDLENDISVGDENKFKKYLKKELPNDTNRTTD